MLTKFELLGRSKAREVGSEEKMGRPCDNGRGIDLSAQDARTGATCNKFSNITALQLPTYLFWSVAGRAMEFRQKLPKL